MGEGGVLVVWNVTHFYQNTSSLLLFPCNTNRSCSLYIGFGLASGVILLFVGQVPKALLLFKAQLLYYCKETSHLRK